MFESSFEIVFQSDKVPFDTRSSLVVNNFVKKSRFIIYSLINTDYKSIPRTFQSKSENQVTHYGPIIHPIPHFWQCSSTQITSLLNFIRLKFMIIILSSEYEQGSSALQCTTKMDLIQSVES